MSTINKVKVDNVIYDIEDAESRELINSLQTDFNDINIPTKVSELENDNNYLSMNDDYSHITGRLHVSNKFDSYIERPVDISTKYLMGAEDGGLPDTLHINYNVDKDVRILEKGTGTLYYKGNEVADREYVDEKIADIEVDIENIDLTDYATKEYVDEEISKIEITGGGGITEIPIASATTLGGIKVGANLTIDEDGTLNAQASGGEGGNTIAIDNLPVGSVVAFDGDEIPYGYEEVEEYIPTYSTEEQRVGTWINGKPLYRKVLSLLSPNSKTLQSIDTGVTGIERFIKIEASIDTGLSANGVIFANYYIGSSSIFYVKGYKDKVQSFTSESTMLQKDMIIIIEYTKITD